jgi:DNA repair exonuclease SbcCD ATPase subunit
MDVLQENQDNVIADDEYIKKQLKEIDLKIAEIEQSVSKLLDEESRLLSQRSRTHSGGIKDIIEKSREDQRRLQQLRDSIEIENAPLPELRARRNEYIKQYNQLKRHRVKEKLRTISKRIEETQETLVSLKGTIEEVEDMVEDRNGVDRFDLTGVSDP